MELALLEGDNGSFTITRAMLLNLPFRSLQYSMTIFERAVRAEARRRGLLLTVEYHMSTDSYLVRWNRPCLSFDPDPTSDGSSWAASRSGSAS